ncbi:MAG: hypothetical protein B6U94_08385 [Thermofilum sp. ex4484_79]|nr:MAG: hypothetical protein B6U94_08385 [Thermofilum sp. ex4484_79]
MLIETDRAVYVVEVKVKPRHEDMGRLLSKADVVAGHYPGLRVVPILTGVLIGADVRKYAELKGVEVYSY